MTKSAFSLLMIFLMCSFVFIGNVNFAESQTGTTLNGTINSNQTWTKANSPYSLNAPTTIAKGVTVHVEPGVAISLNGLTLEINGEFNGVGTDVDPITIDGGYVCRTPEFGSSEHTGSITFTSDSAGWNEQTNSGSIIENARLDAPALIINGSLKFTKNVFTGPGGLSVVSGAPEITNNTFIDASIWAQGGTPLIVNNIIRQPSVGVFVYGGAPQIRGNIIYDGFQGIFINYGDDVIIQGNIIANFSQAIVGGTDGRLTIEDNLLMYNLVGVYADSPREVIEYNTLAFNVAAMNLTSSPIVAYNNMENNNRTITLERSQDVDAENNWWGTTDSSAISQSIWDGNDYYNLGKVTYTPFLESPNSRAPSASLFSLNTPLPETYPIVTPEPTTNPTSSPTPEQTTPTSTETPTAPAPTHNVDVFTNSALWSIMAVLAAVIGGLVVLLVAALKRAKKPLSPPPP
jgi:hypothetical protein